MNGATAEPWVIINNAPIAIRSKSSGINQIFFDIVKYPKNSLTIFNIKIAFRNLFSMKEFSN